MNAGQSPLVKGACLLACVWSPESTKEVEGKPGVHVIFYDLYKRAWHTGGPHPLIPHIPTYKHKLKLMTEMFAASHLLCVCTCAPTHAQGEGSINQISSSIAWCLILNKSLTESRVHWFGQTSLLASLGNPPVSTLLGLQHTSHLPSSKFLLSSLPLSPCLYWDKNPLGSTGWWGCPTLLPQPPECWRYTLAPSNTAWIS